EESVLRVMNEWRERAIGGWLGGSPPWFYLAERVGEAAAGLVGASPDEVVCTGTTTFNIHSLVSTLYRPAFGRPKIVACALEFPTDIYALKSQMALQGIDWREHLVLAGGDEDGFVSEDSIIGAMGDDVSIVHLSSVLYRSGQLLDLARLTRAAHERGIMIGFDCSHSAGALPHRLDEWDVDYAVWCGYKYLCGGPGAPAFIYLNRRFFACEPGLAGWFGCVKERQFDLSLDFEHAPSAGGWQVSSPGILGAAAIAGSLETILEAGIDRIREKSLRMTEYFIYLADELLAGPPYDFRVATPREPERRGGHVALARAEDALRIKKALASRGVVADFRPPDIIRFAPSPLYNTYEDIRSVAMNVREIVDSRSYGEIPDERGLIS
ncbi:MAG TPA: kynureninase, partial [Candidatus Eisenbacteria bacterium]|nr:kynureninase [Candidatus Eisenbacteria bacterium]